MDTSDPNWRRCFPAMAKVHDNREEIIKLYQARVRQVDIAKQIGVSAGVLIEARQNGILPNIRVTPKSTLGRLKRLGLNQGSIDVTAMSDDVLERIADYAHKNGYTTIAGAMQDMALEYIFEQG